MMKKIYQELAAIRKELQAIRGDLEHIRKHPFNVLTEFPWKLIISTCFGGLQ